MKRFTVCMCSIFLLACMFLCAFCEPASQRREVLYFYENYCESCSPEEDFREYFRSLTGLSLSDCDYTAYNVARSSGQAALEEAAVRCGLTSTNTPLVIVDGTAYYGASEMEGILPADALEWGGSTDSVVILLTVPMCESCARAADVLETLPERVVLHRGNLEIESLVVVETIDISEQPELAKGLFEAYGVPDDQRIAPTAFFADRFLSGADAVEKNLAAEVELGWAAGGVKIPAADDFSRD